MTLMCTTQLQASEITTATLDSLTWPGLYDEIPPSLISDSPCAIRAPNCGDHGRCVNTASVSQAVGHCECDVGWYGPFCDVKADYGMDVLSFGSWTFCVLSNVFIAFILEVL